MNHQEFEEIFQSQVSACHSTLIVKAREYATEDRLHNFKVAAELMGCTPEQALGGFMAKHMVSIYDLIREGASEVPMAVWEEKVGDALNYLFLLMGVVHEAKKDEQASAPVPAGEVMVFPNPIVGAERDEFDRGFSANGFRTSWSPDGKSVKLFKDPR